MEKLFFALRMKAVERQRVSRKSAALLHKKNVLGSPRLRRRDFDVRQSGKHYVRA
jgi:hypothetical protein